MTLTLTLTLVTIATVSGACPRGCQSCDGGRVRCPGAGMTSLPPNLPDDVLTIDLTQNDISVRSLGTMHVFFSFNDNNT